MYARRRGSSSFPASPSASRYSAQIFSAMRCATFSIRGSAADMNRSSVNKAVAERNARPEGRAGRPILDVAGLRTYFFTRLGVIKAVDDLSFMLRPRETLAIVGESGCGKSMTALSVMRLIPDPPGRIVGGSIELDGRDLLKLDETQMRAVRGNDISMIFQEPMTSLNPVLTIGEIGRASCRESRATAGGGKYV